MVIFFPVFFKKKKGECSICQKLTVLFGHYGELTSIMPKPIIYMYM